MNANVKCSRTCEIQCSSRTYCYSVFDTVSTLAADGAVLYDEEQEQQARVKQGQQMMQQHMMQQHMLHMQKVKAQSQQAQQVQVQPPLQPQIVPPQHPATKAFLLPSVGPYHACSCRIHAHDSARIRITLLNLNLHLINRYASWY